MAIGLRAGPRRLGAVIEQRFHPVVTVDLSAIAENTRRLAARTGAALMAVVKADGFGHGAAAVARTALAHGADRLGVAIVEEALALRGAGLTAPVLSWLNAPHADLTLAIAADVEIAVPSEEHLRAAPSAALASAAPARIHLHADVGMARDGAAPAAWERLCAHAADLERAGRIRVVGVMGHLGCADLPDDPHTPQARRRFAQAAATAERHGLRPLHRHLAATAGLLTDPGTHHDLVRVGAGLYGIDPTATPTVPGPAGLRWAMTLTAPVVSVRDVPAGTPVGYGHTFTTTRRTRLALLPLGYADGLPRLASGRAEVLLRGGRHPVAGRISMDQMVVDVGTAEVRPGDVATILGPGDADEPTPADWAPATTGPPTMPMPTIPTARQPAGTPPTDPPPCPTRGA
ncbi:alanine racemase [Streptomyces sp. 4503]|uniref:Alanine racemase n=1 Tax=Streptomyces niphimycinicus TaxID=2842201 RepID=A0ABS6CHI2_9ACTN|nr:alanine racemase [Streptomyces niphimycinicus]MBU3866342.1 alanine racemase [Streptomyces niphimycinicus]